MRKLLLSIFAAAALQGQAQTLFTIGSDSVSLADFLYAYEKNNTGPKSGKAMRDYLELYIASKLKVKEAQARGLDTSAQFRSDLEALRAQVLPAYLNDPQSLQKLTEEAFVRSKKDLEVAHILIALDHKATDTAAAFGRANEALQQLRKGAAFAEVAGRYSDDPAAKSNGGRLGFITVFSLPYELENLVYSTPAGKTAPLYRSKAGYHILKVISARPAAGRMQAAQVLLAFPPQATEAEKAAVRKKADSLYQALQKGADFSNLAERFSHDAISAGAGGLMPEFGIGQYAPEFEQKVFALPKDGALSQPFETAHGIHIVKRVKRVSVPATLTEVALQDLRLRVQQSDRMESSRRELARNTLAQAGYQSLSPAMNAALQARTRQEYSGGAGVNALPGATVLFRLGGSAVTADQWLEYARNNRFAADGVTEQPFEQLWDAFTREQALNHYQQNLEQYNADFRRQIAELKEGNLFFEIMQQQVWLPSQNDTAALRAFYNKHSDRYRWNRSADVVVFYAGTRATAQQLAAALKQNPAGWQQLAARYGEEVSADSTRMEWRTVPGAEKLPFKGNQVTSPVVNEGDGTTTFALILHTYNQPLQRSFEEARGAVINDYQAQQEKEWVDALRKKYPVQVNEALLKQ